MKKMDVLDRLCNLKNEIEKLMYEIEIDDSKPEPKFDIGDRVFVKARGFATNIEDRFFNGHDERWYYYFHGPSSIMENDTYHLPENELTLVTDISNLANSNTLNFEKLFGEISEREDCERIKNVCYAHNQNISLYDAKNIWDAVSNSYSAGWLILPESDYELWDRVKDYFTP